MVSRLPARFNAAAYRSLASHIAGRRVESRAASGNVATGRFRLALRSPIEAGCGKVGRDKSAVQDQILE
jgi:hypothetical protein